MPKAEIHPTDQAIARRVAEAREAIGLSKSDLAERMGISKQGFTPYERGDHAFTVVEVLELCKHLGRTPEWLAGLETQRTVEEDLIIAALRKIEDEQVRRFAVAQVQGIANFTLPTGHSAGPRRGNGGGA